MIRTYALIGSALALAVALFLALVPKWSLPPIQSTDYGPPEGEMVVFHKTGVSPPPPPQPEIAPVSFSTGPSASQAYRNVQVLGDVSKAEFDRTMVAITQWVSPKQGCGFCHGGQVQNFAADTPIKQIARQMLQMTRVMNANWTNHVGTQGVTCYSCHAGNNVPVEHWYLDQPLVPPEGEGSLLGKPQAWNTKAKTIREFFPRRPFRMFFLQGLPAGQVQTMHNALATTGPKSFQHDREYAEQVYIIMMQMSNGLGVNCTYCHNSRAAFDWAQSPPNRLFGYSGIKMTTMLNQNYLSRFAQWTPPAQLGPMGDSPKVDCKTCHQGQEVPVGGMQNVVYPALIGPLPTGVPNPVAALNPGIPQLARHPQVGVPASDTLIRYRGEPQG